MTPETYADSFLADLYAEDASRPRSQQAGDGIPGISNTFGCRNREVLTMRNKGAAGKPGMQAIVGQAVDEYTKRARKAGNPHLIVDGEVTLTLTLSDGREITLGGHPDEVDQKENSVTDEKTTDGLAVAERSGSNEQQYAQRQMYALACVQNGLLDPERPLITRNVWVDRSGRYQRVHVEQDLFNPDAIQLAADWWDDVLYAVKHKEEASKDKPRTWCEQFCGHFDECRGADTFAGTDATDDPEFIAAAAIAHDAREMRLQAEKDEADGKRMLGEFSGRAGDFLVIRTRVNAKAGPYYKTEVKAI